MILKVRFFFTGIIQYTNVPQASVTTSSQPPPYRNTESGSSNITTTATQNPRDSMIELRNVFNDLISPEGLSSARFEQVFKLCDCNRWFAHYYLDNVHSDECLIRQINLDLHSQVNTTAHAVLSSGSDSTSLPSSSISINHTNTESHWTPPPTPVISRSRLTPPPPPSNNNLPSQSLSLPPLPFDLHYPQVSWPTLPPPLSQVYREAVSTPSPYNPTPTASSSEFEFLDPFSSF